MIIRWLVAGFVLWLVITLGFRVVGDQVFVPGPDGVSWMFMTLPIILLILTFGLLKMFKVEVSDRAEAAGIFALPGLLIGIYQINSYEVIFPNLDASLANEFAALMFACYAAIILAGIVSSHLKQI
jgi:hypothetical protein